MRLITSALSASAVEYLFGLTCQYSLLPFFKPKCAGALFHPYPSCHLPPPVSPERLRRITTNAAPRLTWKTARLGVPHAVQQGRAAQRGQRRLSHSRWWRRALSNSRSSGGAADAQAVLDRAAANTDPGTVDVFWLLAALHLPTRLVLHFFPSCSAFWRLELLRTTHSVPSPSFSRRCCSCLLCMLRAFEALSLTERFERFWCHDNDTNNNNANYRRVCLTKKYRHCDSLSCVVFLHRFPCN